LEPALNIAAVICWFVVKELLLIFQFQAKFLCSQKKRQMRQLTLQRVNLL